MKIINDVQAIIAYANNKVVKYRKLFTEDEWTLQTNDIWDFDTYEYMAENPTHEIITVNTDVKPAPSYSEFSKSHFCAEDWMFYIFDLYDMKIYKMTSKDMVDIYYDGKWRENKLLKTYVEKNTDYRDNDMFFVEELLDSETGVVYTEKYKLSNCYADSHPNVFRASIHEFKHWETLRKELIVQSLHNPECSKEFVESCVNDELNAIIHFLIFGKWEEFDDD